MFCSVQRKSTVCLFLHPNSISFPFFPIVTLQHLTFPFLTFPYRYSTTSNLSFLPSHYSTTSNLHPLQQSVLVHSAFLSSSFLRCFGSMEGQSVFFPAVPPPRSSPLITCHSSLQATRVRVYSLHTNQVFLALP